MLHISNLFKFFWAGSIDLDEENNPISNVAVFNSEKQKAYYLTTRVLLI